MKKFLFFTAFFFLQNLAQSQTISTNLVPNTTTSPGGVTFVVENTNAAPIILTDVGYYVSPSDNGQLYTLYYSSTSLSGPQPTAWPDPNWPLVGSATVAGVTTTGIQNIISGLSLLIPGNTIYRFSLTKGTTIPLYASSGTNTFSNAGVNLFIGNYQIAGQNVGYAYTITPRYWAGSITFAPATPCSGPPTAGTASYIANCPDKVSLTGQTLASGISFQWQKREGCSNVWTNIAGATSSSYNLTSQSGSTDYRAYIICSNSNLSDTSNAVTVASLAPCYCASNATSIYYPEIVNFTVGSFSNASTCATTGGVGSVLNQYSNYRSALPPIVVSKGDILPFSISTDNCNLSTTTTNGSAIFIDFNGDGDYLEADERVYASATNISAPGLFSGTLMIPTTATSGIVGMRVINAYNTSGASISSCGTYTYGETEDYLVEIQYSPTVTGDGFYCSANDSTVVLQASAPGIIDSVSYLWTLPDGTTSTDSILTYPRIAGATGPSGSYSVVVLTYPCGGGAPDTSGVKTVGVFVQQTPPPPVVAPLITYCLNMTPDTIPVYGQNIKWYSVPTGGTSTTTQPVINTAVAGSFTYYISQTFNGCESERVPVTVQVVPPAPPPAVTTPVTYCQNETATPLQAVGQNLLWYADTTNTGSSIVPIPPTTSQGTAVWYVTQTIDGCESEFVAIEVRINYRPNALITASREYVCAGDTLTISYFGNADGDPNVSFNWNFPSGTTVLSGTGQGPYVVRFDDAGMKRISLVADNDGCESPQATYDVEVRPIPEFVLDIQEVACAEEVVNLVINQITPSIDSFVWDLDGGEKVYASETAGPYGVRWSSGGQKTITVVGTDNACTSSQVQDVITIRSLPDATINTPNGSQICTGDSVLLEAVYNAEYSYQWLPEQFFPENNNYRQWARVDFGRAITLNVTDIYNCKSSSELWIQPENCCVVQFPTAFTPNSDGRNDVFRAITKGNQKITRFVVKNRWGQQVYESADAGAGWDGMFGGVAQDMGVYFYFIKYQCSDGKYYEEKGEIMLIR